MMNVEELDILCKDNARTLHAVQLQQFHLQLSTDGLQQLEGVSKALIIKTSLILML
jgi:hypothetical protein